MKSSPCRSVCSPIRVTPRSSSSKPGPPACRAQLVQPTTHPHSLRPPGCGGSHKRVAAAAAAGVTAPREPTLASHPQAPPDAFREYHRLQPVCLVQRPRACRHVIHARRWLYDAIPCRQEMPCNFVAKQAVESYLGAVLWWPHPTASPVPCALYHPARGWCMCCVFWRGPAHSTVIHRSTLHFGPSQ